MCGFGGVVNHFEPLNVARISKIASKVNFRGPDSCGIRILDASFNNAETGNTAVFFNRLAILDLDSRSNQPFEDERHILVFNGEIYNYTDLKVLLEKEGVIFHTTSDTEVLFFALKRWGKEALAKLNGMFAFFWMDKQEKTFMISRDRLGIKPLYYHFSQGAFYFSSELHSIVRLLNRKPSISQGSVEMYLWLQFIPTPNTILKNVHKLPPGAYIEASAHNLHSEVEPVIYWDAYRFEQELNNESLGNLEEILKDSLKRQLQADVPLGLFLSSGVDSSLLAALVNKHFSADQDINFFTVAFKEQTFSDESAEALSFVRGFRNSRIKTHSLEVDAGYMQTHISELYNYYDEPFGDYASILNWTIARKAREHVTVALSGDGADELFWGYPRYNKWQDIDKINTFPLLSEAIARVVKLLPSSSFKHSALKNLSHDPIQRHFEMFIMQGFRPHLKSPISDPGLWAMEGADKISKHQDLPGVLDIKTYLADAMLYKVDRSSMATSLEVRVPYLDNKVLEYALKLPFDKKSNDRFRNKAILKELLVKLAPHYEADKPKKGFSFPLKKWLKEHWKEQVYDNVTPGILQDMGLNPQPYLSVINDFYTKDKNYEVEVWYLLNLALWKKSFDNLSTRSE